MQNAFRARNIPLQFLEFLIISDRVRERERLFRSIITTAVLECNAQIHPYLSKDAKHGCGAMMIMIMNVMISVPINFMKIPFSGRVAAFVANAPEEGRSSSSSVNGRKQFPI